MSDSLADALKDSLELGSPRPYLSVGPEIKARYVSAAKGLSASKGRRVTLAEVAELAIAALEQQEAK